MSRFSGWVGLTRLLFVVVLAFLIATATVTSPGLSAQGPVKDPTLSPQDKAPEGKSDWRLPVPGVDDMLFSSLP